MILISREVIVRKVLLSLPVILSITIVLVWNCADQAFAQSPPPQSRLLPFSYYKLDEAGTSLVDSAANNPGTAVGTTVVSGKIGNARLLNGAGDYLNLGNISQFNKATKFTVSAWVNLSSTEGIQPFVTKWGAGGNSFWFDFYLGFPRAAFDVGAFITATSNPLQPNNIPLQPNHWYHIVWAYDGTASGNANRLRLYVTGIRDLPLLNLKHPGRPETLDFGGYSVPGTLPQNTTTPVQVGTYSGLGFFLNGIVDEVGFWSDSLSDNMIANLWSSGTGISYEQMRRADDLHRTSLVLLAHTHDFYEADLINAKAGGVTAITAKLTVDGVDWDRCSRTRLFDELNWLLDDPRWRTKFRDDYLPMVQGIADNPANGVRIIRSVGDILSLNKDAGEIGVIIASEGANQLLGNLSYVQEYYDLGWRETQLRWSQTNLLVTDVGHGAILRDFGRHVIRKANRLGILLDVSHIDNKNTVKEIIRNSTSPVLISHDITPPPVAGVDDQHPDGVQETDDETRDDVARSGGGHGVFALYLFKGGYQDPTLDSILDAIDYVKQKDGIDHIALGPDYMPDNEFSWIVPVTDLSDITLGLVRRGYTDDEIKKVLGQNLLELYKHVWNPAVQGQATLRLCSNDSTDEACVAATANDGEGDMSHRPINCRSGSEPGVIGLKLSNVNGAWSYVSNVDGTLKPCVDGSALIASWTETTYGNASFRTCSDDSSDYYCVEALTDGGKGTSYARAVNCLNPLVSGVVGLQLKYEDSHWYFMNAAPTPERVQCAAGSTLVASWGAPASNATLRLCENTSTDQVCLDAAQSGGNGTNNTRAINCATSVGPRGQAGLQLTYDELNHQWSYFDKDGSLHPCLEGSALIVNFSNP